MELENRRRADDEREWLEHGCGGGWLLGILEAGHPQAREG